MIDHPVLVTLMAAIVGSLCGLAIFVALRPLNAGQNESLAARVNTICPKGYEMFDFEGPGEFNNVPKDLIKVTCTSIDPFAKRPVVYRSVKR